MKQNNALLDALKEAMQLGVDLFSNRDNWV